MQHHFSGPCWFLKPRSVETAAQIRSRGSPCRIALHNALFYETNNFVQNWCVLHLQWTELGHFWCSWHVCAFLPRQISSEYMVTLPPAYLRRNCNSLFIKWLDQVHAWESAELLVNFLFICSWRRPEVVFIWPGFRNVRVKVVYVWPDFRATHITPFSSDSDCAIFGRGEPRIT